MFNNVVLNNFNPAVQINNSSVIKKEEKFKLAKFDNFKTLPFMGITSSKAQVVNTTLTQKEQEKYTFLVDYLKDVPLSPNANGLKCSRQLETLLKNGKLLQKSTQDGSTILDNLYDIATIKRAYDLNPKTLISNVLDFVVNPRYINQTFGDIPINEKEHVLSILPSDNNAKINPNLMDVQASGTCAAGSHEVDTADKNSVEYVRWVSKLSSEEKSVDVNLNLKALSSNLLEAVQILQLFQPTIKEFSWDKVKLSISPDKNAYIKAKIQENYWDKGERSVANVLLQSAYMQLGSQGTYDSLTDLRGGDNPQGLIEVEKTFVETVLKNKEITSLVFQQIDTETNELLGYTLPFDKIKKCLTDTIDRGENIIIGYVLTNETSGRIHNGYYNPAVDGAPNKVINGHEITIVDYKTDLNGKTKFICIDTDDNSDDFLELDEDWLLPKIHHGGFDARYVKDVEKEILTKLLV